MIQTDNHFSLIGIAIGSISGIIIAIVNSRKKSQKRDTETIQNLREELDELQAKISSLTTAFTLVFDEMERRDTLPDQLKDFKKIFDLYFRMSEITTDEQTLKLKWKIVFPIIGSLLLISNGFTRYISVQDNHGERIKYNQEAGKRRIKNAVYVSELKSEIKTLEKELRKCK